MAISIPIFTSQLEKSRDAVSISNIRAVYAEAASAVLPHTKDTTYPVGNVTSVSEDGKTAVVGNVVIKSQQKNTWSGLGTDLPITTKPGDDGLNSTVSATFVFDDSGNCSSCTLGGTSGG